ncbi:17768_t:CDS:2 [Rhizophagus irregularis]|nr:17768_t:CDS:2 [Rhizophagus irregularis]
MYFKFLAGPGTRSVHDLEGKPSNLIAYAPRARITIIEECRKYFDATKIKDNQPFFNDIDTLFLNSKTEVIKAHLQPSGALQSSDALSPSITIQPSDYTKQAIDKEELWDILVFYVTVTIPHMSITKELETEIEIELTKEYSFMRDRNPIM